MSSELLAPEAVAIARVKGAVGQGVRLGTWLTIDQAERLISAPDPATPKGRRDGALLALLIGCGLRRKEAAAITLEHIQQREARWVILDLVGKGRPLRSVPMPSWVKAAIDAWIGPAGITTGLILRAINKGGKVAGESMTAQSIFEVVKLYGAKIGVSEGVQTP